ncbi:MAG: 16S rRNA processing protein RimM [Thermodesulfobacterium sp.]|nr:16S rRNA processing protein RimM [Thermodesulfobacterium sp.]
MLIPVAKILSTHGIKGELKVSPLLSYSEILLQIKRFYLTKNKENFLEVENIRKGPGYNVYLVKFKDIDFEEAQSLTNQILYIDFEDLPDLEEDEFYYYQIIGFKVKDKNNKLWGKIKEIMPMGEYDLILVKTESGEEFYIPLVEEYVEELDLYSKTILVKDIKALVESQKV